MNDELRMNQHLQEEVKAKGLSTGDISKKLSSVWANISDAIRQPFTNLGDMAKREHKARFPDWVYNPKAKNKLRLSREELEARKYKYQDYDDFVRGEMNKVDVTLVIPMLCNLEPDGAGPAPQKPAVREGRIDASENGANIHNAADASSEADADFDFSRFLEEDFTLDNYQAAAPVASDEGANSQAMNGFVTAEPKAPVASPDAPVGENSGIVDQAAGVEGKATEEESFDSSANIGHDSFTDCLDGDLQAPSEIMPEALFGMDLIPQDDPIFGIPSEELGGADNIVGESVGNDDLPPNDIAEDVGHNDPQPSGEDMPPSSRTDATAEPEESEPVSQEIGTWQDVEDEGADKLFPSSPEDDPDTESDFDLEAILNEELEEEEKSQGQQAAEKKTPVPKVQEVEKKKATPRNRKASKPRRKVIEKELIEAMGGQEKYDEFTARRQQEQEQLFKESKMRHVNNNNGPQ
ncbi:hypothetical protein F4810DRAFT_712764 [Camillea tinctor]|nr:hypothetical protein F4810DRAFT_712764 [Camillea tinctor]